MCNVFHGAITQSVGLQCDLLHDWSYEPGYVNVAKRGHVKFHIRARTHFTPWMVLGSRGLQDDGNDVKMLFRP